MLDRISRRALLVAPLAIEGQALAGIRRKIFRASPLAGTAVLAYAFYTRARAGDMISIEERWSRSDTVDVAYIRNSHDHGRTWNAPVTMRTAERRPEGMLRRHPRAGFVDSQDHYIEF